MRLLIDTNVLIWGAEDPQRLRPAALELLRSHQTFVSVASLWEVAIKQAIGKLRLAVDLPSWIATTDMETLPIKVDHVWRTRELPLLHRDPFDRLLLAQAMSEGLTLLTSDQTLSRYGVPIVPA